MPVNIFTTIDDPLAPSITEAHGINDSGRSSARFSMRVTTSMASS